MSVIFLTLREPQAAALVRPALPTLSGGALVPGVPCPCDEQPSVSPTTVSRVAREVREWCGVRLTTTTTTYTKDEFPGGTPEEEAAWDAAWEIIAHVVEEEMGGPGYSIDSLPNFDLELGEITECPVAIESETWDPGPLDENPGIATYTATVDGPNEEEWPPVDFSGFPDYPAAEGSVSNNSVASISEDGHTATAFASAWRWKIDLSGWPTEKPWPAGFRFEGTLVWDTVLLTFNDPDPTAATVARTRHTEDYLITADAPVWHGAVNYSDASGGVSPGVTQRIEILPVAGFEIVLPFE